MSINIKSISELKAASTNKFKDLINVDNLIEVSRRHINGGTYESEYINLGQLLNSINEILISINDKISGLSSILDDVKKEYLPLSGGTLTGNLKIQDSNLSVINGNTLLYNTNFNSNTDMYTIPVRITDGILVCKNDISGCALSAKWC